MVASRRIAAHRLETRHGDPNRREAAAGGSTAAPTPPKEVRMARDIAFTAGLGGASALLLPVAAPAEVWARAQREYALDRIDRLPLRARLLQVLDLLDRGHLLALMGATTPRVWLYGCPEIPLLAGLLFTYEYVQIAGRHRETPYVVYFTLSEAGRHKLREGQAWWNGLSFGQRIKVRLLG
jgi:hypothetical protein